MTSTLDHRIEELLSGIDPGMKEQIQRAAMIIQSGGLAVFPTETVYGLGANALDPEAVRKIYEAKGRPSDNPIIIHVCDIKMAESVVDLNWRGRYLMEKFWPGPLSIVLTAKPCVPEQTRGGLPTAAVRMPDNAIALNLIRASGVPIAAPSANKSGRPSPTDAATVKDDIGDAAQIILDGGPTRVGLESTVLDVTGEAPVLLRPGGVSKEEIEAALCMTVLMPTDKNMLRRSPGTRYRHYAPQIPLVIDDGTARGASFGKKWAWIGISEPQGDPHVKIIFNDVEEYARELFRAFRAVENSGAEVIIAEAPDKAGIGLALMDRLTRAAGI
jgi:L-threonylcarbamoyladenylate synthase